MNKKSIILVSLISFLLALSFSFQFKLVQADLLGGMIPSFKLQEMKTEYERLENENEKLINTSKELNKKLQNLINSESEEDTIKKTLKKEMERYKMLAGYTDLEGNGISVFIDHLDDEEKENLTYNMTRDHRALLSVVNELNAAGAEAISINSVRFTASTEIRGTADYITINNVKRQAPFVIKAIGNSKVLKTALENKYGIVYNLRNMYRINIKTVERIRIESSEDISDWQFARPSEKKE